MSLQVPIGIKGVIRMAPPPIISKGTSTSASAGSPLQIGVEEGEQTAPPPPMESGDHGGQRRHLTTTTNDGKPLIIRIKLNNLGNCARNGGGRKIGGRKRKLQMRAEDEWVPMGKKVAHYKYEAWALATRENMCHEECPLEDGTPTSNNFIQKALFRCAQSAECPYKICWMEEKGTGGKGKLFKRSAHNHPQPKVGQQQGEGPEGSSTTNTNRNPLAFEGSATIPYFAVSSSAELDHSEELLNQNQKRQNEQQDAPPLMSPIFEPLTPEDTAEDVILIEEANNKLPKGDDHHHPQQKSNTIQQNSEQICEGEEAARRSMVGEGEGQQQNEPAEEQREQKFSLAQLEPHLQLIAWRFRLHFRKEKGVFIMSRLMNGPGDPSTDLLLFSEEPGGRGVRVSEFRECRTVSGRDGRRSGQWTSKSAQWPTAGGSEQFLLAVRGKCDQLLYSRWPATFQ